MNTSRPPGSPEDLAQQLDHSFGDGPPQAPVDLTTGHRALARRRAGVTGLAAVAVAAVAVSATLLGPGGGDATSLQPADRPTVSPAPIPAQTPDTGTEVGEAGTVSIVPADPDVDVELYRDGTLAKQEDVTVTERVRNPLGLTEPDHSLGLAYVRGGGETTWALLTSEVRRNGKVVTTSSSDPAGKSFPSLRLWLDDQVALQNGEEAPLQLVEFDGGGETLLPLDGVEILQQRGGVDLGASFAGPGDPTAVAEVRVDGERWYVLARTLEGSPPQYLPTAASVGGATLDDFLDYAAGQYAEGGGGLR